jgi:4-diphosphocytidyl-2-C-methyl-D-erythritol kinase
MFKINDFENVFNIGAKLGSDVPFFLRNRTFAVCEKRGEVVSPIDVKADMPYVLIVFPSINISTKRVYESMNYDYIPDITLFDSFLNELMSKKKIDFSKYLFNRLESATFAISGEIRDLKNMLLKSGVCALMSGSGSSVFAMSYDIEKLKKVYEEIYKKFDFVFLTKFV